MSESSDDTHAQEESASESEAEDVQALRKEVEEKYDFENFGPQDMQQMSPEEWDAAFDPDTWITGTELLDRVEADLKHRVATRDVFARVERFDELIIAYSDSGYAAVYGDGTVEGSGTVLRDVKPTVALCSMDSYDVPDAPDGEVLPEPQEVPESSDALGNTVLQVVAGVQVLAGVVLIGAWALFSLDLFRPSGTTTQRLNLSLLVVIGIGFLIIGIFLFVMVANARLSDKFRSEEFRNRLRAIGVEDGDRPDFLDELDGIEHLPEELTPDERTGGSDTPDVEGTSAEEDEHPSSGSA